MERFRKKKSPANARWLKILTKAYCDARHFCMKGHWQFQDVGRGTWRVQGIKLS